MSKADVGIDAALFRELFQRIATPVAIVTAVRDGSPAATTVSAFSALSMTPPLVLVALDFNSNTLAAVKKSGRFAMNVLSTGHESISLACASKDAAKAELLRSDEGDPPRVPDAIVWLECEVTDLYVGGDHAVVVGLIRDGEATGGAPLLYHERQFVALR